MLPAVGVVLAFLALGVALYARSVSRHALRVALDEQRRNDLRALGEMATAVQLAAEAYVRAASAEGASVERNRVAVSAREYVLASRALEQVAGRVWSDARCRPWLALLCDERHPELVVRAEAAGGLLPVLRRLDAERRDRVPATGGSALWRWRARLGLVRLAARGLGRRPSKI